MRILESSEDYLEAMLMMQERFGYIRSIDIEMCIRDSPLWGATETVRRRAQEKDISIHAPLAGCDADEPGRP